MNILAISEISILEFFIITDKNFIVFENNIKTIKTTFNHINNNKIISTLFVNSHLICGTDDNMIDVYQINPLQNIKVKGGNYQNRYKICRFQLSAYF